MRTTRRVRRHVLVAVVVAGGLALTAMGASAFTASNTLSNSNTVVGFGTENVTGATVTSIVYGLDTGGDTVTSATVTTSGDTSGSSAWIGFTVGGVAQQAVECAAGTYTTGSPGYTTYDCSSLSQALSTIQAVNVAVD